MPRCQRVVVHGGQSQVPLGHAQTIVAQQPAQQRHTDMGGHRRLQTQGDGGFPGAAMGAGDDDTFGDDNFLPFGDHANRDRH